MVPIGSLCHASGMLGWLLFGLLCLPFGELALLIYLGRHVGILETLGLALATSVFGAALAKQQGLRVVQQWQRAQAEGRVPEEGLVSGMLVLVGAALLVLPGFISDVVGLLFLLPPTRMLIAAIIRRFVAQGIGKGRIHVVGHQGFASSAPSGFTMPQGPIIEVVPQGARLPEKREND